MGIEGLGAHAAAWKSEILLNFGMDPFQWEHATCLHFVLLLSLRQRE